MAVTIREPADKAELTRVGDIYAECMREDFTFKPQSYLYSLSMWSRNVVRPTQKDDANRILAAFDGQEMIGFAGTGKYRLEGRNVGELSGLFVLRDRRGTGLGLRLMKAAARHLKGCGYDEMAVYSYTASRAHSFYKALGGLVCQSEVQQLGDNELVAQVLLFNIERLLETLSEKTSKYE